MVGLLATIDRGKVDYLSYTKGIELPYSDVSIIIPARGRRQFFPPLLKSLHNMDLGDKKVSITVVEHSFEPEISDVLPVENYIHLQAGRNEPFNKCLCMNIGAIVSKNSPYLLFHDSDLLVNRDFLTNVFINLEKKGTNTLQTFAGRKVLYCERELTSRLINGQVHINDISPTFMGVYDKNKPGAPGGSIFIARRMFFEVGGFDPELFHSYSQEDLFFWDKVSLYVPIGSCDNPRNEVYHMHHEFQQFNNPQFKEMLSMYTRWSRLSVQDKIKICEHKKELLKKYE